MEGTVSISLADYEALIAEKVSLQEQLDAKYSDSDTKAAIVKKYQEMVEGFNSFIKVLSNFVGKEESKKLIERFNKYPNLYSIEDKDGTFKIVKINNNESNN